MKILQITPQVPYPPIDGGKRGIFNITKPLAERGHEITMIALSKRTDGDFSELKRYCSLEVLYHDSDHSTLKMVRNLFSSVPYTVSKYHDKHIVQEIFNVLTREDFDIVHIDTLHCAYYGLLIKQKHDVPVILRLHDYATAMMERFASYERNIPRRVFSKLQVLKLTSYEGPVCSRFDRCLVVSEDDEAKLKKAAPDVKSVVIPPGVDTSYFTPGDEVPEPNSILWFGALSWHPNFDGLMWFLNEIFPRVLLRCPAARFVIAGSGSGGKENFQRYPQTTFIGFVEDIRKAISKYEIAVVPLRIGSGVRLKLIELFSMGKPAVSTTVGAEGTGAIHGEHLLLADSPDGFADSIIQLFEEAALRRKLSRNARDLVLRQFDCNAIAETIETEYLSLAEGRRANVKKPVNGRTAMK